MKDREKVKFVNEMETSSDGYVARKPFKVERQKTRRFIRLEISSPMDIRKIKDSEGDFSPEGDWHSLHGMILNISAGGVLVELDQPLFEGDVVCMHFILQEVENLDNVLGLVKRTDRADGAFLAGIEFITREYLSDIFSETEMDLLPESMTNFNERVREVLAKYVTRTRISGEAGR
jgi:hypothetical protein